MLRKVDELGRIVLPIEHRKKLNISENDDLEITLGSNEITIRKPTADCHFCQSTESLIKIGTEHICKDCIQRLHDAKDGEAILPAKAETL